MKNLVRYFSDGVISCPIGESIGVEIETQFLNEQGNAVSVETSQNIIRELIVKHEWAITNSKGTLITAITSPAGDKIFYELGRHNLELSSIPLPQNKILSHARKQLRLLYEAAKQYRAWPLFSPIFETDEDLLVIPDRRDATWLELDGKDALNLLARTSAVQFTIDVPPEKAIHCLNIFGASLNIFLLDYPQETLWRKYIRKSKAGYDALRYGGPLFFNDMDDYCSKLVKHKMVSENCKLVPFAEQQSPNIPLFLRSIWWYFRLRRYGEKLCIEVRPLARRTDDALERQLEFVMSVLQ